MAFLHHVSILSRDLDRSRAFYRDTLGLQETTRPPFRTAGAWFKLDAGGLHVILNPAGTFRAKPIVDSDDGHFALRVPDFEAALAHLRARGRREDADDDDPMRLLVIPNGPAGFPQAYLLDPDWNIIEINAER